MRSISKTLLLSASILFVALPLTFSFAARAQTACDRDCLISSAKAYLNAIAHHDLNGLPLAADARITENLKTIKPGEGVFLDINYFKYPRQFVADTKQGEVGVQGVLVDRAGEAIFGMRFKVENKQIKEIEILLTHDGMGGPAFEPAGFLYREAPYIDPIPAPLRTPREALLEAARNFWVVATTTHTRTKVPFTLGCDHMENGMNTDWEHFKPPSFENPAFAPQADGRSFLCGTDLDTTTMPWHDLGYYHAIADEERGIVMVFNTVQVSATKGGPFPGNPNLEEAAEAISKTFVDGGFDDDSVPPGLTMRGMPGLYSDHTMYHVETLRILDGKIDRDNDFLHRLPANTVAPWSK